MKLKSRQLKLQRYLIVALINMNHVAIISDSLHSKFPLGPDLSELLKDQEALIISGTLVAWI
jgi:hypothetical protein